MILLVTGGSGSGKSAYAESRCMELKTREIESDLKWTFPCNCESAEQLRKMFYVATMEPFGEEGERRIARHRKLRAGKGFETLECYTHLEEADIPAGAVVLLECLSNLAANEMYSETGRKDEVVGAVMEGIHRLAGKAEHLVIVTNNVFSDGISYDDSTKEYQRGLARVNAQTAGIADEVVEVVAGIPIRLK
ncbi:MAG: bifunctional adenosylcobinamide kinase/adenosylcobinamide-phosphate guanylyltransferase [Lachnospiraceae bacterium]|nr:bifunctional adenosylcobinamide kinase/adenosylcobinamide-phosphate guanylyltransferase [Lachnospiraceae bacterium]